ncbi:MAG: AarF/ABC1/UbiB kinase family protein, partial [Actinobacteria bacterium]|nr:AarF/ABC1/UbiB kinase family protein [Actinomycetota bacterium]
MPSSRAIATGIVVAGAVGGALAWWRRQEQTSTAPVTPRALGATGRTGRNVVLAKAATKAGGSWATDRARRVFADAERREHLDTTRQLRTAEQVAETLGHLKGAMMKLGQMASYLDQGLPEHVRGALADLRQDAPPMSPELAAGVVTEELGRPPTEAFADWDPIPVASASIGQVHHAVTHDGREVAVKVQYPGVERVVATDL